MKFRNDKNNAFTKKVNKIALKANDYKKNAINRFDKNMCKWIKQRL